jgi:uncharacterized protein YnzC (UPF0291/DUF896 family)
MIEEFSGLPVKINSEEERLKEEYIEPTNEIMTKLISNVEICDENTDFFLKQTYVYEARDLAQAAE